VGISTNSLLTLVTLDVKAWASFVSAWHPLNAANELTHSTLPAARGCRCPELYYACRCPGSGRVFLITKSVDAASPPSHRRRCLPVCAVAHVLHMSVCLRRRTRPKQRRPDGERTRRTPQMVGKLEEPPVRCVCACVHANGVVMVGTNVVVRVCVVIWPAHAAFALTWIAMIYVRYHRCPYACRRCQAR
jgi:hypothetical protein